MSRDPDLIDLLKIFFDGSKAIGRDLTGNYHPPRKRKEDPPTIPDCIYPESDEEAAIAEYEEKMEQSRTSDQNKEPEVINLDEQKPGSVTSRTYSSHSPADRVADFDGCSSGAGHPPRTWDDFVECAAQNQGVDRNIELNEEYYYSETSDNSEGENNHEHDDSNNDSSDAKDDAGNSGANDSRSAEGSDTDGTDIEGNFDGGSDSDMNADGEGAGFGSDSGSDGGLGSDSSDSDGGTGGDSNGGEAGSSGGDYEGGEFGGN